MKVKYITHSRRVDVSYDPENEYYREGLKNYLSNNAGSTEDDFLDKLARLVESFPYNKILARYGVSAVSHAVSRRVETKAEIPALFEDGDFDTS